MLKRLTPIVGALLLGLSTLAAVAEISPAQPSVNPKLAKHQARFATPEIVRVTDKVYAAVGYDIANFAFIVGDSSVVVFDTGMQTATSAAALRDFRKITDKPIAAIVYSHGHLDHAGGIRAFINDQQDTYIPIYAGSSWRSYRNEEAIPKTPLRAFYQMGVLLPVGAEGTVGAGTGPVIRFTSETGFLPPTHTIETDTEMTLDIPGVNIILRATPSDIHDGISAWLPDEKVVLTGDLIYPHFPAIATPRFEKEREVWRNLESIDWVRQLPAEHLIPGHLHVISGRQQVATFIENFRDTIQFMNDQTIRLLREGLGPDETAAEIRAMMPAHLRDDPNLGEHYHRLEWVVKGLYTKSGGWYSGDVVQMIQIDPKQRADRITKLIGGADKLRDAVEKAYTEGDLAWAAELGRHLQRAQPNNSSAKKLLATVLRALAYQQQTANARNYLLTEALVLDGSIDLSKLPIGASPPEQLRSIDDRFLLRNLAVRLDPQHSIDRHMRIGLTLTRGNGDIVGEHTLIVRRGVLDIQAGKPDNADLSISLDREIFLLIAGGNLDWSSALANKQLNASNDKQLHTFSKLFVAR